MGSIPLEITLVSANGLRNANLITRMDVYAIVHMQGVSSSKQQKTPVDKGCGTSPLWNYTMKFSVNEDAAEQDKLVLKFTLISRRIFGDKVVGEVSVPFQDLLDGYGDKGSQQKRVSYCVRSPSGQLRGTLQFVYRLGERKFPTAVHNLKPSTMGGPVIALSQVHMSDGYAVQNYSPPNLMGLLLTQYCPPQPYPPSDSDGKPAPPVVSYGYLTYGPPPPQSGYDYGHGYRAVVQVQQDAEPLKSR